MKTTRVLNRAAIGLLFVCVGALTHFSGACSSFQTDEFECGRALETDTTRAKVCDQPSESCVCNTNRCAIRTPDCPSGLEYSFGERECVTVGDAKSAFTQRAGAAKFCPGVGAPRKCGVAGGEDCGADAVCICSDHRCAEIDSISCPSGYRYVGADDCVDPLNARPEVVLFPDAGPTCSSEDPPSLPCGVSHDEDQTAIKCAPTDRCVCKNNIFRCAQVSPGCASGYAYLDGACIKDLTTAEIEAADKQVDANGVCPQYAPRDGGKD